MLSVADERRFSTLCFHNLGHDIAVIRTPPHELNTFLPSLKFYSTEPRIPDLGLFSLFPDPVICSIFLQLDILSCFRFRQANKYTRELITRVSEYQILVQYAPQLYRAILRTNSGLHFDLARVSLMLRTWRCRFCTSFGGFIHLPTFSRCCFRCLSRREELSVIDISMTEPLRMGVMTLPRLPVFTSIPGLYGITDWPAPVRMHLVGKRPLIESLEAAGRPVPYMVTAIRYNPHLAYLVSVAAPFIRYEPHPQGYDITVDAGVYCKGCYIAYHALAPQSTASHSNQYTTLIGRSLKRAAEEAYSMSGFYGHYRSCLVVRNYAANRNHIRSLEPDYIKNFGCMRRYDVHGQPR